MATSKISIDEGSTLNTATNTISEDAVTKHIPRSVLNTSAGVEVAPLTDTQLRASAVPVSVATIPSHAVTNAGTFAVQVDSSTLPTGAATSAKQLADGHNVAVASIAAGTALIGKVGIDQATANANEVVVKSGTVTTVSTLTNQTQMGGQNISMGTGTRDAGTQRVTIATNDAVPVTFTDQKIDLDKVAGASIAVDNGTAATSIRVTVASDSTGQIKLAAGTAEIGKLAAGTAEIGKLGAGTANIGDVDVLSFANGKTILRAVISGATSGDNTIVAADATKKIKVLSVFLVAATAVTVRFESAAGGTALTGVMSIGATGGFVLPPPSDPSDHWFETSANQLLNMELGGAVQVSGAITYYLEA
jgi:hypothetical protein